MPMRAKLAAVACAAIVLGVVGTWTAGPAGACDNSSDGSYVECDQTQTETAPGEDHTFQGVPVPVDFDVTFVRDGEGENEGDVPYEGCWGIEAVPQGEGSSWAEAVEEQALWGENGGRWGTCAIEDTIDPAMLAELYWYASAAPPPPTPLQLNRGYGAITGLPAYLEIGGANPYVQTIATPIGALTFTMTPRYVVSWGDGATLQTGSQGGPHPTGDIVHTYIEDGGVTITVEAYWRTSWTLAGAGGSLPELSVPTSASLDLLVEEYQAVIDPE